MTRCIWFFLLCMTASDPSWALADETSEALNTDKSSVSIKINETGGLRDNDLTPFPSSDVSAEESSEVAQATKVNFNASPVAKSVVPTGVSLQEFLEFGMVPVEDLEAELASPVKNPGLHSSGGKAKYYTVYTRAIGTGGLSGEGLGAQDNDASDEDEEDPEDEDDEPEDVDL